MNKIFFLAIVLFAGLTFGCNDSSPKIIYEVIAKNGGENGFNDSECNCNSANGKNTLEMSKPGYEKRQHCCFEDFSTDVQRLILMCDAIVDLGVKKSGEFETGNLKAEYDIKDKYNYSYIIHKK